MPCRRPARAPPAARTRRAPGTAPDRRSIERDRSQRHHRAQLASVATGYDTSLVALLASVNVGLPRDVAWRGRTVHTAVWKQPVAGPVRVRRLNLDGDGQGDLAGHGGEQRAVLVYQLDSYRYWQRYLNRDDFTYGQFGENFTVEGLPDDEVCVGRSEEHTSELQSHSDLV